MKKKIGYIVLSCTMALVCTLFSGCSEDYFSEEDFGYYYVESEDCYAAVNNRLRPEDILFVPAYYRDKEVRYTSFNQELLSAIVGIIWKAWHKKPIFLILINGGERRDNMIMSLVDTIWY